MRRVLIATTVLLLLVLSSWSATVDSLELNDSKEANGRAANVVISELFIMANLVTNLLKYGIPEMRHKMSQVGFFQQLVVALHANYHTIQY